MSTSSLSDAIEALTLPVALILGMAIVGATIVGVVRSANDRELRELEIRAAHPHTSEVWGCVCRPDETPAEIHSPAAHGPPPRLQSHAPTSL